MTAPGPFRTMAHGDTRIIPLELQETYLPVRIEEFSLRQDSAGAGQIPRRARLPQELPHAGDLRAADQSRPHEVSALGRAGRQGGEARPLHAGATARTGAERSIEKEKGFRSRRAISSASRPAAAAAMVRRPSGRSTSSNAISMPAIFRAAAAVRDYGVTIDADGKARR